MFAQRTVFGKALPDLPDFPDQALARRDRGARVQGGRGEIICQLFDFPQGQFRLLLPCIGDRRGPGFFGWRIHALPFPVHGGHPVAFSSVAACRINSGGRRFDLKRLRATLPLDY